jgi:hypothetical protein
MPASLAYTLMQKKDAADSSNLYCLHPVVVLRPSTQQIFQIKQSNCLHWFYLTTATCFGLYFGSSSGSLTLLKYPNMDPY